jgi:MEMO1 family protein
MSILIRQPAVAGRFYPLDAGDLRSEARAYLSQSSAKENAHPAKPAIGCIAPHAGYIYSGHVAGAVFVQIEIPNRCIVLCPNHTGAGHTLAIMSEGAWRTPLGDVPIDGAVASALKQQFPALQEDSAAHRAEHAVEVELPFLQLQQPELTFVPIALGTQQFETLEALGKAVAEVISRQRGPILIIASSDMNHYEPDALTRVKDHRAIEPILRLDARGLHETVTRQKISMCGMAPAVVMLTAARLLGARSAELVKYATSGDVSGDREMVVGYAGIIVA